LRNVIADLLAKSPEDRPQLAADVIERLGPAGDRVPMPAPQGESPTSQGQSGDGQPPREELEETLLVSLPGGDDRRSSFAGGVARTADADSGSFMAAKANAPQLLARETQVDQLERVASAVRSDSRSRLVVISGDSGLGKTRLAQEVRYSLESRGWFKGVRLLCGGGREEEAVRHLILRLLYASRLQGKKAEKRILQAASAYGISPIDCAALARWGAGGEQVESGPERIALAARVLRRIGAKRPLVLVLDEADNSDGFASAVLESLFADDSTDSVLFVLATSLRTVAQVGGPFRELFNLLASENKAFELPLGPFSPSEVDALVRPLVGDQAPTIASAVRGNPKLALEMARLSVRETKTELESLREPEDVEQAQTDRLASHLSSSASDHFPAQLLGSLALLGTPQASGLVKSRLASIWERARREVEASLDEWISSGVLVEEEEVLSFSNPQHERLLMGGDLLSLAEREAIVSQVAGWQIQHSNEIPIKRMMEILDHLPNHSPLLGPGWLHVSEVLIRRGDSRAKESLRKADREGTSVGERARIALNWADIALTVPDLSEARRWCERAEGDIQTHHLRALEPALARARARIARLEGDLSGAQRILLAAVAQQEQVTSQEGPVVEVAAVFTDLADLAVQAGRLGDAERYCRRSLRTLGEGLDRPLLVAKTHL
ncbi:MAG: ATP-binding protein, partial [Myxococcales bacterium]|nr:ATP-binding protein [Myxococcales bacterium]